MVEPVTLRSPFTGEPVMVPPEHATPAFIDALVKAGFVRLDPPKKEKR